MHLINKNIFTHLFEVFLMIKQIFFELEMKMQCLFITEKKIKIIIT